MGLIITITAFALLIFFTLVWKKSLLIASIVTLLLTIAITLLLAIITLPDVIQAGFHGMLTAIEISLLIFGALAFYHYLKAGDFLQKLEQSVVQFTTNKLVVTNLLILFFGSFLEGISGFGTPAMIIAPLLLALGFPPLLASALPLLANTAPVLFGAEGTPVKIGFADLPVAHISSYAATLMVLPVMVLPLFYTNYLAKNGLLTPPVSHGKIKWIALGAGAAFALPFISLSFLGPEFPTILASITGLLLWLLFIKKIKLSDTSVKAAALLPFFRTIRPYLFMAILLLAAKLALQNTRLVLEWPAIQLQKSIALFQPGLFFIAGIFAFRCFAKQKPSVSLKTVFGQTLSKLPAVAGTISCLAILARLLSQHLSITELISTAPALPHFLLYAAAIFTGSLGSFMTGSATMSNLLFGAQWYQIGLQCQLPSSLLLACQLAGAAIGNAISLQNIVMVQAVLKENQLDRVLLHLLWKPVLLLLLLVCCTAALISFF